MGWFRQNKAKIRTLDVLNELTIEGRPVYASGYPGKGYKGRDYFVNNVQGNSGNSGKSWNNAIDEFSTAVTASAAYLATLTTLDQNVRNRIFIQGTGTPYSAITALPSYCDVIGIGADPRGNGAGIVRIGADTGTGESGLSGTSSVRGLHMYNVQFQAGNGGYAFQMSNIFRSRIHDCVFATNGSPAGAPAAGFEIAIGSGLWMHDCNWLNQSSAGNGADVGFDVTGTHFHGCIIERCNIHGADAAFRLASTTVNGWDSYVDRCRFGFGSETCTIAVDDNATAGYAVFTNCYSAASTDYSMVHNGAERVVECYAANALVTAS